MRFSPERSLFNGIGRFFSRGSKIEEKLDTQSDQTFNSLTNGVISYDDTSSIQEESGDSSEPVNGKSITKEPEPTHLVCDKRECGCTENDTAEIPINCSHESEEEKVSCHFCKGTGTRLIEACSKDDCPRDATV